MSDSCESTDWSLLGSIVHGILLGSQVLLQGILPTQGSNLAFLHCGWILHCLRHQGSPEAMDKH